MYDFLGLTHEIMKPEHGGERAEVLSAYATAALAEEARTANLLKLAEMIDERFGGTLRDGKSYTSRMLVVKAAERMGLK